MLTTRGCASLPRASDHATYARRQNTQLAIAVYPIRVRKGLAHSYATNLPENSVICPTCFKCARDGIVPDVTMTLALIVECQVCKSKYPTALWGTRNVEQQGFDCAVFWYPAGKCLRGAWGSREYDYDEIRIASSMPSDVLSGLLPHDYPICDQCVASWVEKKWLETPIGH